MNITTIIWVALPFFLGFCIYLFPRIDRYLALCTTLISTAYALNLLLTSSSLQLQLLNNFGVILVADQLSGLLILTSALVMTAVIIYCWNTGKTAFFYMQTIILHGSVNAAFICADFISLYVALEVIGIAAFLLISYPRSDRSIWVGLRYLFISNTAMLFYLVGAVLVYETHQSFAFAGLRDAPTEAIALIFLGLLTKGGIFVSGFWLPLTHSESQSPVSAMLSGVVVKTGAYALVRIALLVNEVSPIVQTFGVGTALLGVFYAIWEKDTKRTLALSSVSQLGWVLVAPQVGGFYALSHGLVKAIMFLSAGVLPSRDFQELQQRPMSTRVWIILVTASLSISGFPLLVGFAAKMGTLSNLTSWQAIAMNIGAVGTAIVYAKFIFLPHKLQTSNQERIDPNYYFAVTPLIAGLIIANLGYLQAYTLINMIKSIAIIAVGWLGYLLILRRTELNLPRVIEKLENLIGVMSLMLMLLLGMVLI